MPGTSSQRAPARRAARAGPPRRKPRGAPRGPDAAVLPVARVAVDIPLAHLDRPFDYLVPERLADQAVPGCRVRVRFAGQLTDGYLLERAAASQHPGQLARLERVVSPEPVLSPELAALAREVADRYAGTMADVLRLAIPPRHARTESALASPEPGLAPGESGLDPGQPGLDPGESALPPPGPAPDPAAGGDPGAPGGVGAAGPCVTATHTGVHAAIPAAPAVPTGPVHPVPRPEPGSWSQYRAGPAFLDALASGRAPRAVWSALPGPHWPDEIARAAGTAAAAGRGALIVVPDARDLSLLDAGLTRVLGPGQHITLAAGLGPAERYRRWLVVRRGTVRIVAGTRAAMFAPVADLGLVVLWDDGDDLHAEPRAPYPHARDVLALRAHRAGAAALIGGFARTAEATSLVASGWARPLSADRAVVRDRIPQIQAAGADSELARDAAAQTARLPSLALRTARAGLASGPVLVQVPRRGYLAALGCARCRARARCATCGGPLSLAHAGAVPGCCWCGAHDPQWRCPRCAHGGLRAMVTGAGRTAEELGHAFPGTPLIASGGAEEPVPAVPGSPALVIATPGAEPRAAGGYAAALLLDGWALLGRPSLRAAEEALRRWLNAAALVRGAAAGGRVVVVADAGIPAVQALIRWDPATHAERELAERVQLRFPPAVRMASLTGPPDAVDSLLAAAQLPDTAELLGPVEAPEGARMLLRVPRSAGQALAAALRDAQAVRSARKDPGPVRVQLDPAELS